MSTTGSIHDIAAQAGFGALVQSVQWKGTGLLGRKVPLNLHRFENGAVAETRKGPIAFPYGELQVTSDSTQYSKFVGAFAPDRPLWNATTYELTSADGTVWTVMGAEDGTDRSDSLRLACDAIILAACAAQVDRVRDLIAADQDVRFGDCILNARELIQDPWPGVAWTHIDALVVADGKLEVSYRTGRKGVLANAVDKRAVRRIANFPLFYALAEELVAQHGAEAS